MNRILNEFEIIGDLENTLAKWCEKMTESDNFQDWTMYWSDDTYALMAKAAYGILQAQRSEYQELDTQGQIKEP